MYIKHLLLFLEVWISLYNLFHTFSYVKLSFKNVKLEGIQKIERNLNEAFGSWNFKDLGNTLQRSPPTYIGR